MSSIKQIRANRRNAQRSTGPQTPAAKEHVRFNALTHGLRAETVVLPGEDQSKFDQHLARLSAAWLPEDDVEKDFVEQIAVNQWKLVRIDKSEAKIYAPGALPPGELALAIHRLYLTQARLERSISCTIADLQNYRKDRLARHAQDTPKPDEIFSGGLIWKSSAEDPGSYSVLPKVRGLDGVWREIPRELLADFPKPPAPSDKTAPPVNPKPNGSA